MNEPRYQVGLDAPCSPVPIYDGAVVVCEVGTTAEAQRLCDLLNAGEQARALAAAVAGIGRFRVRKLDTGLWCAIKSLPSGTKSGFADTPVAAIVALWQAVQATGEGEHG